MTIKNTYQNISAEPGSVIIDLKQHEDLTTTAHANNSNDYNFANDLVLDLVFLNFLPEEAEPDTSKHITVPLSQLIRKGYLEANYYNKTEVYNKEEIDAHVKLHYEVLQQKPNKTNAAWAAEVRENNKQNYIFLVPFGTNYDTDASDETQQDGTYAEYIYTVQDYTSGANKGEPNLSTEKMEMIGSTKLDLTGYELEANLNDDVWGPSNKGFRAKKSAETGTNATTVDNMTIGEYALWHLEQYYYNKTAIDDTLGTLNDITNQIYALL